MIQSHRLGGGFAYRTDEAHAYASVHPVITPVKVPVAETYHAPIAYRTPVTYETKHHTQEIEVPTYHAAYAAPAYHTYAAPAHAAYAAPAYSAYAAPHYSLGPYAYNHLSYAPHVAVEEKVVEAEE